MYFLFILYIFSDGITISKEKYVQLVDQSIELTRQKILVQKLKESITKKCSQVKELNKMISKHKYLLKKKTKEKQQEETKEENRKHNKQRKECSVSFGQNYFYAYFGETLVFMIFLFFFKGTKAVGNFRVFTVWQFIQKVFAYRPNILLHTSLLFTKSVRIFTFNFQFEFTGCKNTALLDE